jgi:MFS family permease
MAALGDGDDDEGSEEGGGTVPSGSIYAQDTGGTRPQGTLWLANILPFHYGYLVLVVCGIGLGMSGPGQTTTFGVLVGDEADPHSLMSETGVSRSGSSVLWMVATFGSAATMLRFGFLLDQLGPMKALSATAVLLGASLLLLSFCSSPTALFGGLYCLRLFGQGCMMLIPPYTVALWWVQRRGFAYAITLSIGSIGINYGCEKSALATAASLARTKAACFCLPKIIAGQTIHCMLHIADPMLAKSVMEMPGFTWRDVLRCEALICIVGTLPLGLLFYRGRPELYGLLPDGRGSRKRPYDLVDSSSPKANGAADEDASTAAALRQKQASKAAEADARSWTARDALRTTSLWATCGGVCLIACISMGVWFHLPAMVTDATEGHVLTSAQLSRVLGTSQNGRAVHCFDLYSPIVCRAATDWLTCCITGVQTVGQMLAKFCFSWMLDRFSVRVVLLSAVVVQLLALGTFCVALVVQLQLLAVVGVGLQAAALGGAYSVDGVSYAKFFGRDALGSITGATKACWQVATAIGPTPLGLVRDHTGTFVPALVGSGCLCVVAFGVVLMYAKRPSVTEPRMLPCFRGQNRYDELPTERSIDQHDFDGALDDSDDDEEQGGERGALIQQAPEGSVPSGELQRLREENARLRSELQAYDANSKA